MLLVSPKTVYHNLGRLEQVDSTTGAYYRQMAQDALADTDLSLTWRQAIANRLNQANHRLEMRTATANDSY
ncbi:hypothetical protein [Altericista sp. CCNU0014]|uniref:hypothetical protein n=1 Tax=Altericista sp. CCNU0014 TaxID=3082949 RepID=UPI00384EE08D